MSDLRGRLLADFQRDLPLTPTPYADMAARLGVSEGEVLETLKALREEGAVSRVGAVFRPNTVGASTLAALAVPVERLEEIAALINAYAEVNHNYEREHHFNLWFVVTASDTARVAQVLDDIAQRTGFEVMDLPMVEDYHLDLGFDLRH